MLKDNGIDRSEIGAVPMDGAQKCTTGVR